MRHGKTALALVGSVVVALVVPHRLPGQVAPGRPQDPSFAAFGALANSDLTAKPAPRTFRVWTSRKNLDPDQLRAFEQVRSALTDNRFSPAHRRKHFAWIAEGKHQVSGWTGDVTATEPIEGGYLVTMTIGPKYGAPGGSQVTVLDHSVEVYKVFHDGSWDFVEGRTPPGTGQPSFIIN